MLNVLSILSTIMIIWHQVFYPSLQNVTDESLKLIAQNYQGLQLLNLTRYDGLIVTKLIEWAKWLISMCFESPRCLSPAEHIKESSHLASLTVYSEILKYMRTSHVQWLHNHANISCVVPWHELSCSCSCILDASS